MLYDFNKISEVLIMRVEAPIKVDRKTKRLAKRLTGGEIAVINHMDIDEVAANSLVEGKVKLVINAAQSISGKYPNKGPGILTDKNILIMTPVYGPFYNCAQIGHAYKMPLKNKNQEYLIDYDELEKMLNIFILLVDSSSSCHHKWSL